MRRRWRTLFLGYIYVLKSFLSDERRGVPTRIVLADDHMWQVVVVMGSFSPTSVIGEMYG